MVRPFWGPDSLKKLTTEIGVTNDQSGGFRISSQPKRPPSNYPLAHPLATWTAISEHLLAKPQRVDAMYKSPRNTTRFLKNAKNRDWSI